MGEGGKGDFTFNKIENIYFVCRQLVLALGVEQNQLKSTRNKIQEVNWQRKQEQVTYQHYLV